MALKKTQIRKSILDKFTKASNLIINKDYELAIDNLQAIDDDSLDPSCVGLKYLNLAIAYDKIGNRIESDHQYLNVIKFDNPTGMAYEKIAIS